MARKSIIAKVFAFLALFGIILGIIGTGVLFIFGNSQIDDKENQVNSISKEELQKLIESGKIKISSGTKN